MCVSVQWCVFDFDLIPNQGRTNDLDINLDLTVLSCESHSEWPTYIQLSHISLPGDLYLGDYQSISDYLYIRGLKSNKIKYLEKNKRRKNCFQSCKHLKFPNGVNFLKTPISIQHIYQHIADMVSYGIGSLLALLPGIGTISISSKLL